MLRPAEIAVICAWAPFTAWTVRRLWRPLDSRYTGLVYGFGVRFVGIFGTLFICVGLCVELGNGHSLSYVVGTIAVIELFSFPFGLWAGYVSGRALAYVEGIADPNRKGAI